jgi:hypothetical protein
MSHANSFQTTISRTSQCSPSQHPWLLGKKSFNILNTQTCLTIYSFGAVYMICAVGVYV